MTEKRFMVDDAGTLIDMQTRNTYDYVSDVCPLLNALNNENEQLKQRIKSRLHYYRELYESTNDNTVKRVIEDLEDILR